MTIEAEASIVPKLDARVRDGVLYLENRVSPIITQEPIRFHVVARALRALTVNVHGFGGVTPVAR